MIHSINKRVQIDRQHISEIWIREIVFKVAMKHSGPKAYTMRIKKENTEGDS